MESTSDKKMCLTVPEVAVALGVSKPTAYNLANRADFPAIRLGKRIIVPREAFEKWVTDVVANGRCNIEF